MKNEDKTKEELLNELAELRRNKALFEGIFEFSPDAVIVVDGQGNIVQINKQAEAIFGYIKDELLGKPVEILIPERFREEHAEQVRFFVSHPRIRFFGSGLELYGRRKDGSEFPADILLGPLQAEDEIVVLSIVRDITEHKKMENMLRASEAKYRGIFENSVEGIFQTSVDGHILAVNLALARMLGYGSPDELMAEITDARKLYVEPGRRLQFVRTMRANGIITDFEAQIHHKAGNTIWVLVNAHALYDSAGNVVAIEGMVTDITGRKRAERNFQMLIDSAPDAIVAVDSSFNIVLINTQTESLLGYKRDELLGKSYQIIIPEQFKEKHTRFCMDYFAKPTIKQMALHLRAVAVRKDGNEVPVEINMSPFETDEGLIVITDIRQIRDRTSFQNNK